MGPETATGHTLRGRRHPCAHSGSLLNYTKGVFSGYRTQGSSKGYPKPPIILLFGHGCKAAGPGPGNPQGPCRRNLSSFIGVDGTNATLNGGRIPYKPKASRETQGERVGGDTAFCSRNSPRSTGSPFFMQPVQDLTVDARVSRTQFQYTMEDPDANELYNWAPRLVDALKMRLSSGM